jgi:hypothetical protein
MAARTLKRDESSISKIFANTETIHGFKYIADEKSSKPIRIFWILSFVVSIICFGYYANKVYKKLYVEPEIGVRASSIPSQSIPFPAISMCPSTKVRKI